MGIYLVFYGICYLVGSFMDQVPATAFFLAFASEILDTVGYKKEDKYSNVLVMGAVFAVNLGGAATPISHSLAILGMGIYEQTMGTAINLLDYMIYAVPTTLVLLIIMCLLIKFAIRPDVSKISKFDIDDFVKDERPMDLREKSIVTIFFFTVIMWILPGILEVFLGSKNESIMLLKQYSITFWAFAAVVILSVVRVNNKPLINLKEMMDKKLPWATIFFISIGVLLGSALSVKETGINDFVVVKLSPILEKSPELAIVFLFALGTTMLTNISSNVSTITIMTVVALSIAAAVPSVNPMALAITTTMAGSLAYVLPSSFATIAMLHSHENSDSKMVYLYGCIMVLFSGIVATFLGYNLFDYIVK